MVRPCGVVVLKTTVAEPYEIPLSPVVIDEVHVIGSRCGPFPKAIAALADRRIDQRCAERVEAADALRNREDEVESPVVNLIEAPTSWHAPAQ
jgi:hypothetical protein